jgi:long-chain fatty acid transport protein
MMTGRSWRLVGVLATLMGAAESRGAGFEFPDNGTQALGRGGAFTAKADDLTALQYNVAGLAKLRGTHLLIDLNLVDLNATFARAGNYPDDTYLDAGGQLVTQPWSGQPFPKVRERRGPNVIPIGGVATDFGLRRFTFALGLSGPSSVGNRAYPEEVTLPGGVRAPAPQRFDLLDENILIGYVTFAAAWRPLDWLHVGAAFQWGVSRVQQHVYAMAYTNANQCRSGEAWACSTKVGIDLWDWFAPTGIVSTLVRPPRLDHLEVGLSFRLPFDTEAKGSGSFTPLPALAGISIDATGARLKTSMPFALRTGVRWFFGPREDEIGDVEVDVVYEGWSRVKAFDTVFTTSLGDIAVSVPQAYRDTVGVRVGGAYNLKLGRGRDHRLALRAGGFFEQGAAPMEWTRTDFDAWDRVGFAVGAGTTWRGLTFGVAFSYQFTLTRDVTNSLVTPIYAIGSAPADQPGLDGRFTARQWVLSLGAAVSFDELLKKRRGMR